MISRLAKMRNLHAFARWRYERVQFHRRVGEMRVYVNINVYKDYTATNATHLRYSPARTDGLSAIALDGPTRPHLALSGT